MRLMDVRMAKLAPVYREELAERIASAVRTDGVVEPIEGLRLTRATTPTDRVHAVSRPCLCVIAQGTKEVFLGETMYRYDPEHYLLATIEVPLTGRVVNATREHPYLALRLELDPVLVGSVMVEAALPTPTSKDDAKAVVVSSLDSHLLDATMRLVRLLDSPNDSRVLLPLVKREVVYRLLTGEQGARLRHLPMQGGHANRIAKAVDRLRDDYNKPLRIENLAKELGMSSSGFHQHFKAVTDMSPLQFQKQLRLQEARRLMLGENLDAASAGYRVGYDDASHFSKDYKRLFGIPPASDAERLRGMVAAD
jgi:AraC-like DNA-binding protein